VTLVCLIVQIFDAPTVLVVLQLRFSTFFLSLDCLQFPFLCKSHMKWWISAFHLGIEPSLVERIQLFCGFLDFSYLLVPLHSLC